MITKRKVSGAIDKASIDIEWCWKLLTELRESKGTGAASSEIINFQKRLINSLWILDDMYREIHAEKRRLVASKNGLNFSWFKQRMAALSNYQTAVRHAISIAKTIGDGFVWIFYQNETKLIDAHLKAQRQVHLPPKIGRIGERAFVEKYQVLNERLVLYHGITTFLRMGDISFYDFSEGRITNIGELKTEHVSGDEYRIHLGFVYGGNFSPVIDLNSVASQVGTKSDMRQSQKNRLDKQLKQIATAIAPDIGRVSQSTSQQGKFYFDELDGLIESSAARSLKTAKMGRGLLIATLRLSGDVSLSGSLLGNKKFHVGKKLDGITVATQSIMDAALNDNSLLIGNLGVSERGVGGLIKGAIPIFWWPLKLKNLHDLIFSEVICMTLYNPAHFWSLLRAQGFEVHLGEKARLSVAKRRIGRRVVELHNFDYFQILITRYLMSEESVMSMIEASLHFPVADGVAMRIEISPQLRLGHRDTN